MRTATPAPPCSTTRPGLDWSSVAVRCADYLELSKPRIIVLALITVSVGYALGSAGNWNVDRLWPALFGIALVAAGSAALNQFIERETDCYMRRTANRPLPAGRLRPGEALLFGIVVATAGTFVLAVNVNVLTAVLTLAMLVLYVFAYTPLKRRTSLCTTIGAIPGALPPVLGWTAAGGELDIGAFSLFAIMFLWQFPHFLAIAWLYHAEYAKAGLIMLPTRRPAPRVTGFLSVGYALALMPVSLLPSQFALAGSMYFVVAVILGLVYLAYAVRFLWCETPATARRLLWSSLVYLPVLLLVLTWDHWRLLR